MTINIKVKLRAKEEKIEKDENGNFIIWTRKLPIEGRANEAVIKILAEYFNIPAANISIISGFKSRQKKIEII